MKSTRFFFFLGLITAANHVKGASNSSGANCSPSCCTNVSTYITDGAAPIPTCTTSSTVVGTSYPAGTMMSCTCSTSSQLTAYFNGGGTIFTSAGNTLTLACQNSSWVNIATQGTNALLSITCP